MKGTVLAINSGSSSVKFASFDIATGRAPRRVLHGVVEGLGLAPRLRAWDHEGGAAEEVAIAAAPGPHDAAPDHAAALAAVLDWLARHPTQGRPLAAAHRVVHGGLRFTAPVWATPAVLDQLQALCPLAPLHQPHNLAALRVIAALQPGLPQLACFDTAFHAGQDPVMRAYALPRPITQAGVQRYGFHGLSYETIAAAMPARLGAAAEGRVVVAHLGNGASLCAMQGRRSVATSMGFTALDGLMMGTRCGQLDPGVVLYLMSERGMTVQQVEKMLYQQSGLLGVSGLTQDMRTLQASALPEAQFAIALYVNRISRELGGLAAMLGGLDALVFTGGIGENSALIRERVCAQAAWLGLQPDPAANAAGQTCISAPRSRVSAWVLPTDEEGMLARHAQRLLEEGSATA